MTSQAPHLVRTVLAMLSGIAESKIRVVGGDIGGGFGNKVPVYPGLRGARSSPRSSPACR